MHGPLSTAAKDPLGTEPGVAFEYNQVWVTNHKAKQKAGAFS